MINKESILYLYNSAVLNYLKALPVDETVFGVGSTEASVPILFQRTNAIFPENSPDDMNTERVKNFPVITLSQQEPQYDITRHHFGGINKWTYTSDGKQVNSSVRHPTPISIIYTINLVSDKISYINQLYEMMIQRITPEFYINVTLPEQIGNKWLRLDYDNITDDSTKTTELPGYTIFNKVISLKASAWVFDLTPELIKLIESVQYTFDTVNQI